MLEGSEMITSGVSKDHIPFGRFAIDLHSASGNQEPGSKSLSEGVGNISIYDSQVTESWNQRVVLPSGHIEELYFRDKTVLLSSTCGSANGTSKIIKSYTVQSKIHQAFWCSFMLPSNEVDCNNGAAIADEVQEGFCIIESNCVTIVAENGSEHHVTLPFHIVGAWPLERGVLLQRMLENKNDPLNRGSTSATLPIWFSMLHPLADLSPVICRSGTELSYVSSSTQHVVYVSSDISPYLSVIYDTNTRCHSMYLIRRTTPQEEKTYIELNTCQPPDTSWHPKHSATGASQLSSIVAGHLTPNRTGYSGFLTLSSVLSPATKSMSPRIGTFGTPSLRGHNITYSPANLNKLNPSLSVNSPSLTSMNHLSNLHKSVPAASPSVSASVAHSSFTSTGNHHQTLSQDVNMSADMLEPIRPDICLQHVWTDYSSGSQGKASRLFISTDLCGQSHLCMLIPAAAHLRCIKLGASNSTTESVIFGSVVNIPAKDACVAPSLNMVIVLDLESNIRLYTGPTQISMLYVPRLSFGGPVTDLSTTPIHPSRSSIRASSRPGSAKGNSNSTTPGIPRIVFDTSQGEGTWSPVQMELNDSTNFFLQRPAAAERAISSLHSITKRRLVLKLSNGEMVSTDLPGLCADPVIGLCIQAFSTHLPYNVAIQAVPHWYLLTHIPGQDENREDELDILFKYVLEVCGFPTNHDPNMDSLPGSPNVLKKRAKTVPQPSDSDFESLISSSRCNVYRQNSKLLGLTVPPKSLDIPLSCAPKLSLDEEGSGEPSLVQSQVKVNAERTYPKQKLNLQSPLSSHIYVVFHILHLCYEELKLNSAYSNSLSRIAEFLTQLSTTLQLDSYTCIYLKDFPHLASLDRSYWGSIAVPSKIQPPPWFPLTVQSLPCILASILRKGTTLDTIYYLPQTTHRLETLFKLYAMYGQKCVNISDLDTSFIHPLPVVGRRSSVPTLNVEATTSILTCGYPEETILLYMCKQGMDQFTLDSLPFAYTLLLYEAIYKCQSAAKVTWPNSVLRLIKRLDMAALSNPLLLPKPSERATLHNKAKCNKLLIHQAMTAATKLKQLTGMEVLDQKVLEMRWRSDLRIEEVKRCLNSSQPAKITLQQKPEVSDHHFIELKQRHLLAICQRTMALPVGRGMLTLRSHRPVLTESLHIPILCLSGKSYPTQSSVELSNDSHGQTTTRLSVWPAFHNGVAAGLCLDQQAEVDTAWILYNKPKVTEKDEMNLISEHAGFLMALGLNGHLSNLARLSLHDYLIKGHEMTAVGILLGISASMRGTMDISTVRLLTIHTPSLLPPSTTQLDIAHSTKIAALIGLGLVYHSSTHRHIAGVLLHEIDHPPDIIYKGVTNDRESYSLAAGLALGMVMMGKGADMIGLHDLNIANQLCLLMTGGHRSAEMSNRADSMRTRRSGNGQVYEGELINIDVTSSGATLALGLTYFNTKSKTVCDWLKLPQSQYLLESVRPDLLQLRVIAHALIRWENVLPGEDWVLSYLPLIVSENAFKRPNNSTYDRVDYETHSQAYCYIISGACFSIGLKFAGSSNKSAYDTLLGFTRKFLEISQKPLLIDQSGRQILENALCTCLLALAMVMSGSGDLQVFRLCRYLRTRVGVPTVSYGSYMAIHMALALLFLGSGRYTLSSTPDTIPLLICAFFPKFPAHSNDNRLSNAFYPVWVKLHASRPMPPWLPNSGCGCGIKQTVLFNPEQKRKYHLQALRHLYVQAAEPRLLTPVDIDSGEPCYVPVEITLKPTQYYDRYTYWTYAPNILPNLDSIEKVEICDKRYWPMTFTCENNFKYIRRLLSQGSGLAVKRRYGHFPYTADPGGVLGAMTRAMLLGSETAELDDQTKIYIKHQLICMNKDQIDARSFLYLAMRETVSRERPDLLSVYHRFYQVFSGDTFSGIDLQQIFFLSVYKKVTQNCVLSKDLADLGTRTVKLALSKQLSTQSNEDKLNGLVEYCVRGKLPIDDNTLRHMALHSDVTASCIKPVKEMGTPILIAKLHLNNSHKQKS